MRMLVLTFIIFAFFFFTGESLTPGVKNLEPQGFTPGLITNANIIWGKTGINFRVVHIFNLQPNIFTSAVPSGGVDITCVGCNCGYTCEVPCKSLTPEGKDDSEKDKFCSQSQGSCGGCACARQCRYNSKVSTLTCTCGRLSCGDIDPQILLGFGEDLSDQICSDHGSCSDSGKTCKLDDKNPNKCTCPAPPPAA